MPVLDFPGILRAAGLKVVEHGDWRSRNHGTNFSPIGVLNHHTGGHWPGDLDVVTSGRSDLVGPLCNLYLAPDGTFYVISGGVAWHAGSGDARVLADLRANVAPKGWAAHVGRDRQDANGNAVLIGIEVSNMGGASSTYPTDQIDALITANAALLKAIGRPATNAIRHAEWTDRKDDISWAGDLRGRVDAAMNGPSPQPPQEDDMDATQDGRLRNVEAKVNALWAAIVPEDWDGDPNTPPDSWLKQGLNGIGVALGKLDALAAAVQALTERMQ